MARLPREVLTVGCLGRVAQRRRGGRVRHERTLDRLRRAADGRGIGVMVYGQAAEAEMIRDGVRDVGHGRRRGIADVETRRPGRPATTRTSSAMLAAEVGWNRLRLPTPIALRGARPAPASRTTVPSRGRNLAADSRRPHECDRNLCFVQRRALERDLARRIGSQPGATVAWRSVVAASNSGKPVSADSSRFRPGRLGRRSTTR